MFDKILNRLFSRMNITGTHDGSIYLIRWVIFNLFGRRLYIHKMLRPDMDRCCHDHNNMFLTFCLYGGYKEELPSGKTVHVKPCRLYYRPAKYSHRICELPKDIAYTLVFMGKKTRSWGFWTKIGWMSSREFLSQPNKSAEWCATEKSE